MEVSMSTWLYQMSQTEWSPNAYRMEVWEGRSVPWPVGQMNSGGARPEEGDVIVLLFAPSRGPEGGFCGWGVVTKWQERSKRVTYRPVSPTDRLKLCFWWDEDAKRIADGIRGRMKQGTMWLVEDELALDLRRRMARL
jgi:hypothetical protein